MAHIGKKFAFCLAGHLSFHDPQLGGCYCLLKLFVGVHELQVGGFSISLGFPKLFLYLFTFNDIPAVGQHPVNGKLKYGYGNNRLNNEIPGAQTQCLNNIIHGFGPGHNYHREIRILFFEL